MQPMNGGLAAGEKIKKEQHLLQSKLRQLLEDYTIICSYIQL